MVPQSIENISALLQSNPGAMSRLQQIESESEFLAALNAFATEHALSFSEEDLAQSKRALIDRWLTRYL